MQGRSTTHNRVKGELEIKLIPITYIRRKNNPDFVSAQSIMLCILRSANEFYKHMYNDALLFFISIPHVESRHLDLPTDAAHRTCELDTVHVQQYRVMLQGIYEHPESNWLPPHSAPGTPFV